MYSKAIEAFNRWIKPLNSEQHTDISELRTDEQRHSASELLVSEQNGDYRRSKLQRQCSMNSELKSPQERMILSEPISHKHHDFNSGPSVPQKHKLWSEPPLKKSLTRNSESQFAESRSPKNELGLREHFIRQSEPKNWKLRDAGSGSFKRVLKSLSLEALIREIRLARDKAYDGDPMTPFEEFLFEQFQKSIDPIETIAKKLKARAQR